MTDKLDRRVGPQGRIWAFLFLIFCGCTESLLCAGSLWLWYSGLSLQRLLLLWSTGSRCMGFGSCSPSTPYL